MHEAVSENPRRKLVDEYEYVVTIKTLWFSRRKTFTATTINGAILKAMNKHRFSSIEAAERIY